MSNVKFFMFRTRVWQCNSVKINFCKQNFRLRQLISHFPLINLTYCWVFRNKGGLFIMCQIPKISPSGGPKQTTQENRVWTSYVNKYRIKNHNIFQSIWEPRFFEESQIEPKRGELIQEGTNLLVSVSVDGSGHFLDISALADQVRPSSHAYVAKLPLLEGF